MKTSEQYFPVVLFIMLRKVVLTFKSGDEILKCDHSNESYWAALSCGGCLLYSTRCSYFWGCGWNPKLYPLQWNLLGSSFCLVLFVFSFKQIKFGSLFFLNLFISPLKSGSFFPFFIFELFLAIVSVWFSVVGGDISCSANPVSCVSSQSKQWGNLAGCRQTRKRKQRRSESKVNEICSPVYYSPLLFLLVL